MSQKLYCGDCRTVISAEGIDLSKVVVVTDPPFNIGYHYKSYKDRMAQKEYVDMMIGFIKNPSVIIHYPESLYEMAVMGGGNSLQGSELDIQFKPSKTASGHCFLQRKARFFQSAPAV